MTKRGLEYGAPEGSRTPNRSVRSLAYKSFKSTS
jgi:hypothetical protein